MKPVPEPRAESPEPKAELKVLLIDDTPEIAELLTFALRDRGFEVVAEGYSALINELIDEHQTDAVVLDCSVYDMSESLFDTIRDHPPHADLPVVIISDTPEEADASLREREALHVLLVPKPFTASQVARALGELLPKDKSEISKAESREPKAESRKPRADAEG